MKQISINIPNVILKLSSNSYNKICEELMNYFSFVEKKFETVKDDFSDGVTRILTSTHWISQGGGKMSERNKYTLYESHLRELTPSRKDLTASNKIRKDRIEAVCFTFIQVQADVLVVIDYLEHWQNEVDIIKSDMLNIFYYSELTPANLTTTGIPAPLPVEAGQVIEPPKPPEPKKQGGKINLWLDWYHAMLDNGYKCTLENVAKKSGYSLGYIKQMHMVYQAKPNQKT